MCLVLIILVAISIFLGLVQGRNHLIDIFAILSLMSGIVPIVVLSNLKEEPTVKHGWTIAAPIALIIWVIMALIDFREISDGWWLGIFLGGLFATIIGFCSPSVARQLQARFH